VPWGVDGDGLSLSVQIVGGPSDEATLLALSTPVRGPIDAPAPRETAETQVANWRSSRYPLAHKVIRSKGGCVASTGRQDSGGTGIDFPPESDGHRSSTIRSLYWTLILAAILVITALTL
jgi:hypothetical protein